MHIVMSNWHSMYARECNCVGILVRVRAYDSERKFVYMLRLHGNLIILQHCILTFIKNTHTVSTLWSASSCIADAPGESRVVDTLLAVGRHITRVA